MPALTRRRRPIASSTSSGEVTGVAPSRSSAFVPAESADVISPGHGEHLTALLEREVGRDQRAAPLAGLDHDRRLARARRRSGCAPGTATAPARRRARTRRRRGRSSRSGARAARARAGSRGRCRSRARRPCVRLPRARRGAPSRRCRARGRRRPRVRPRRARARATARRARRTSSSPARRRSRRRLPEQLAGARAAQEQARRRIVQIDAAAAGTRPRFARRPAQPARRQRERKRPRRSDGGTARSAARAARRRRGRPSPPRTRPGRARSRRPELRRRAVRERLGDVLRADRLGAGERGDRSRHARDPRTAAARERQPLDGAGRAARCASCDRGSGLLARASRAAATRVSHRVRALARRARELAGARARHASTTRSKRSSSARESLSRYAASRSGEQEHSAAGSPRAPHGQRFIVPTSWNRAGKTSAPADARDRDRAVLERLAQRLERRPRELRQLVEEQHAAVREGRLAGPRATQPPPTIAAIDAVWCGARNGGADQSGRPGGSRPATEWMRVTSSASSGVERRQDAGQAAREHRLAGARRPAEQQVVAAGGGDLERAPRTLLSAHVGEVGPSGLGAVQRRRRGSSGGGGSRSPRKYATASARCCTGTGSMPASADLGPDSAAQTRRRESPSRRAPSAAASAPRNRPQPPVERELADRRMPGERIRAGAAATRRAPPARSGGRTPSPPCAGRRARG